MFFFHIPKNPRLWSTTLSQGSRGKQLFSKSECFFQSASLCKARLYRSSCPNGTLSKVRLVWLSPWRPTLFPVGLSFTSRTLTDVSSTSLSGCPRLWPTPLSQRGRGKKSFSKSERFFQPASLCQARLYRSGGPTGTLFKVRLVWLSPWRLTIFPI